MVFARSPEAHRNRRNEPPAPALSRRFVFQGRTSRGRPVENRNRGARDDPRSPAVDGIRSRPPGHQDVAPGPAQGPDGGWRPAAARRRRHPRRAVGAQLSTPGVAQRRRDQDPEATEHRRDARHRPARPGFRRRRLGGRAERRSGRGARHPARPGAHRRRGAARSARLRPPAGAAPGGELRIRAPGAALDRARRDQRRTSPAPYGATEVFRPKMPMW